MCHNKGRIAADEWQHVEGSESEEGYPCNLTGR